MCLHNDRLACSNANLLNNCQNKLNAVAQSIKKTEVTVFYKELLVNLYRN